MLQNDPPEIIPSAILTIPTAKYIIERREKEKLEIHTVRTESYEFLRKEEGTSSKRFNLRFVFRQRAAGRVTERTYRNRYYLDRCATLLLALGLAMYSAAGTLRAVK